MKLKKVDAIGILNLMNLFNVTTRGVMKRLDNIENGLIPEVKDGVPKEEMDADTGIEESAVHLFSENEFDGLVEGVSLSRGARKRLEYLLVIKKEEK